MMRSGMFAGLALAGLAMLAGNAVAQGAKPLVTLRDCADVCPQMIVLPPGKFTMGAPESESVRKDDTMGYAIAYAKQATPVHQVTIRRGFALGKYPVTRGEFAAFVRETGYHPRNACRGVFRTVSALDENAKFAWNRLDFSQTDRDPVICVSWYDAKAYVAWLSRKTGHTYRLPSEAEFEYAARAGMTTTYYWGNDFKDACAHANVFDYGNPYLEARKRKPLFPDDFTCNDKFPQTSPVGSFPANPFGLYDMVGNVAQWTEDCWIAGYDTGPATEMPRLTRDCPSRVRRGGGFVSSHWDIRSAGRAPGFAREHANYAGFRVVREL